MLSHDALVGLKCIGIVDAWPATRASGVLVGGVVVDDEVQFQALGCLAINRAQEHEPLLVNVTVLAH